jgi:phosphoribosyl-AMP cyclohydrolase
MRVVLVAVVPKLQASPEAYKPVAVSYIEGTRMRGRRTMSEAAEAVLAALRFDRDGLVAAVAQQHDTAEVLMLAWMNREAVAETLATGRVCYWSRSRQALWRKGESSGHTQRLVELRVDCDGDAILVRVDQTGPACHTGEHSCFFRAAQSSGLVKIVS